MIGDRGSGITNQVLNMMTMGKVNARKALPNSAQQKPKNGWTRRGKGERNNKIRYEHDNNE